MNTDKQEVRKIIEDVVSNFEANTALRLELIKKDVKATLDQATKTNGRVDSLEDTVLDLKEKEATHSLRCVNVKKIRDLQDQALTDTNRRKFLITTISIAVAASSVIGTIIGILSYIIAG